VIVHGHQRHVLAEMEQWQAVEPACLSASQLAVHVEEPARLGWMWRAPQVTEVDLGPHVGHSRVDEGRLAVSSRQDIVRSEVAMRQAGRLRRQHLRQPLAQPFERLPLAGGEFRLHPWL
jgi:hypothetical protein